MTNPHVSAAQQMLDLHIDESREGGYWQSLLLTLLRANVEATLAVAVELQGLRQREGG